jgi:hypothetical protein
MQQTSIQGMIVAKDVGGIEMGVLENGTPFLTARGLAKACGVVPSAIIQQGKNWLDGERGSKLARLIQDAGFDEDSLYVVLDGNRGHAYPDNICTIIIEYYALDVGSPQAISVLRVLARQGLRSFIYSSVGYSPEAALPSKWNDFHARILLDQSPPGYFSVFKELAEFLLRAIRAGLVASGAKVPESKDLGLDHRRGFRVFQLGSGMHQ